MFFFHCAPHCADAGENQCKDAASTIEGGGITGICTLGNFLRMGLNKRGRDKGARESERRGTKSKGGWGRVAGREGGRARGRERGREGGKVSVCV